MSKINYHIFYYIFLKRSLSLFYLFFLSVIIYPQSADNERTFVLGFTENTFDNINSRDLKAATELLTQEIIANSGKKWKSETLIYKGQDQIISDLTRGNITALAMSTYEYLLLKDQFDLIPVVVPEYGGYFKDNVVILASANSNINSISDLRNKQVMIQEHKKGLLADIWLTTILNENKYDPKELFFGELYQESESTKSIMNLFFGKVDACITTKQIFKTMADLNPQIGKSLRIVEESEPLVFAVICLIPNNLTRDDKDLIVYTMETLHEQNAGSQILKIFRINKLIKYNEAFMINTKDLIERSDSYNFSSNKN